MRIALLLVLTGCRQLLGLHDLPASPEDAVAATDATDATTADAPAGDAMHHGRVVFLNFDGATLLKGPSDATANQASWLMATNGTVPPYAGGTSATSTIVDALTARLSVITTVTTVRPSSGQYVMVLFGGTASQVHSFYTVANAQLDCGDVQKNDVAWIAESVDPTAAADKAMGAIGFGLGLSSTQLTDDCMCSWGDNCSPMGSPCMLRNGVARDQNVSNDPNTGDPLICPGATQDELSTFEAAFQ